MKRHGVICWSHVWAKNSNFSLSFVVFHVPRVVFAMIGANDEQALLDYTTLHPLELPFTQHPIDVGFRRGDSSWSLDHIMFYSDDRSELTNTTKRSLSAVAQQKKGSCKLLSTPGSSLLATSKLKWVHAEWDAKETGPMTLMLEQVKIVKLGNFLEASQIVPVAEQLADLNNWNATSPVTTNLVSKQDGSKKYHNLYALRNKSSLVLGRTTGIQAALEAAPLIIPAHRNAIKTLRFVTDGTPNNVWLLSGSGDKTIKIWKCTIREQEPTDDWSCSATLTGHQHSITAVDGILSSSSNHNNGGGTKIKKWSCTLEQVMQQ